MNSSKSIGYFAILFSTLFYGTLGISVRNIEAGSNIITFARLALGFVFLLLFLLFKREIRNIKLSDCSWQLVASGILLALTSLCYINAIQYTTLANAVFLLYLGPIIAVVFASIFLREKFTAFNGFLLGVVFLGFLFLLEFNFSFNREDALGYIWGIAAAFGFGLYVVLNRAFIRACFVLMLVHFINSFSEQLHSFHF